MVVSSGFMFSCERIKQWAASCDGLILPDFEPAWFGEIIIWIRERDHTVRVGIEYADYPRVPHGMEQPDENFRFFFTFSRRQQPGATRWRCKQIPRPTEDEEFQKLVRFLTDVGLTPSDIDARSNEFPAEGCWVSVADIFNSTLR